MLCFAYVFVFILDSFFGNLLKTGHHLKQTPCLCPIGLFFRHFSLQCTLIIQFQQVSNCSKLTVNNRKRCEICSDLTITTYQNDVVDFVLVSLLLAFNILYNFFYCFYFDFEDPTVYVYSRFLSENVPNTLKPMAFLVAF